MPIFNMAGGGGTQQKIYQNPSSGAYRGIKVSNTFTTPTKYDSGENMNPVFQTKNFGDVDKGNLFDAVASTCDTWVFPEYFTSVYFNNTSSSTQTILYLPMRNIIVRGKKVYFDTIISRLPRIDLIDLPNVETTGTEYIHFTKILNPSYASTTLQGDNPLVIKAPKLTRMAFNIGGSAFPILTGSDFSSVTNVVEISGSSTQLGRNFNYVRGELELPECTSIGGLSETYSGNFTLKVPKLTTLTGSYKRVEGAGTQDLYIGPNLNTSSTNLGSAATLIEAGRLRIHIPSGDSTTKTTLDTAGLTYTQDYIIE